MSSNLSATAAAFTLPTRSSANITEPKLIIACRENEEIGTYEDGLLKPRKGVASLIVWKDNAPFTTSIASATNASLAAATPSPFATPLVDPSAHGFSQTTTAGGDAHKFHQDEGMIFNMVRPDYQHQFLSAQVQDFQEENLVRHQPLHPAFAQYNYQTYGSPLPCDVAVSEVNRPVWDPAYHKAVSPSIERANQVVEEFKLYFGDGRAPDLLLSQLQKICLLCGLGETNNLPKTSEECTTILSKVYLNVFDLVEAGRANEQGSNRKIQVPVFKSSKEFFAYSKQEGKVCPRWIGKANPLFQDVMNRFRR